MYILRISLCVTNPLQNLLKITEENHFSVELFSEIY